MRLKIYYCSCHKKMLFVICNLRKCMFKIFDVSVSKYGIYRILKENNLTNKKIYNKIVNKNKRRTNCNTQKLIIIYIIIVSIPSIITI